LATQQLFRARELIVFSALSARRLFQGSPDYCNFDTYAFVVQNYQAGDVGAFSFFTRRRDGGTNQLWDTKEFTFLKPLHVDFRARARLDSNLLQALLNADKANDLPFEAIVEFNRANTDSIDVPIHIELVMLKSAFEFLLSIHEKSKEFVRALERLVPKRAASNAPSGPMIARWKKARPNTSRPLEAWALEFCDLRGGAAHGKFRGGERFVWSEQAHLAFGSLLFPLLAKRILVRAGFLQLNERDDIELDFRELLGT
jgi:hypothetical protein